MESYFERFDEILQNMAREMLSQDVTDSITVNFIKCMIPHHQAAIYMCENLLKYTNYIPLQKIAENIIQMQTKGIKEMREILKTTKGYINSELDVMAYMNRYLIITNNMIDKMKNSPRCNNINLSFIGEMIPHHEGSIAMCNNLLRFSIDPRLKEVAESIIEEQSNGVRQMEEIRKNLCEK